MSEKLISIEKKGGNGGLTETTLWTNLSPSSAFAGQFVTLSSSLANYDVCRIYYKAFTTSSTELYVDYPKDFFIQSQETVEHLLMGLFARVGAGATYARMVKYISGTQLQFDTSYRISNGSSSNDYSIPTKICGVK